MLNFNASFQTFNCIMTALLGTAVALFLPIAIIFYIKKFPKWTDDRFTDRYGAFYDGLRTNKLSSIIYHVFFVIRRLAFALVAIFGSEYIFLQIWTLLLTSTLQLTYLFTCQPFESPFMHNIEVFNELTTIALSYVLFLFSPANLNYDSNSFEFDLTFIFILASNILVHLIFLTIDSVQNIKEKIKARCCKRIKKAASKSSGSAATNLADSEAGSKDKNMIAVKLKGQPASTLTER